MSNELIIQGNRFKSVCRRGLSAASAQSSIYPGRANPPAADFDPPAADDPSPDGGFQSPGGGSSALWILKRLP
jgi:hypothetical protein